MALLMAAMMSLLGSLAGFLNWRRGILVMIAIAAVQDPVRKLVPGTPGYLVLMTAPVFFAVLAKMMTRVPAWWRRFAAAHPPIARAAVAFAFLSAPAAVISLTYGPGSWMATALGVFSYSLIVLSIVAGFFYSRSGGDLLRLLGVYVTLHGLMLLGAFLEYSGRFNHLAIIGDAALGFDWVRYGQGYIVEFVAGFYRSGDVMGWHASAVFCLSVTLAVATRRFRMRWLLLSAVALFAVLLCGRRKMVFILPVFMTVLLLLYAFAGRGDRTAKILAILAVPALLGLYVVDYLSEQTTFIRYYADSGGGGVVGLLTKHGVDSVVETIRQAGFFGHGLGFATPGSHHLPIARPRIWQESGPSRLFAELGVPGAIAFLVLVAQLALALFRTVREELKTSHPCAPYAAGLFAFFVANIGSLTVSGQILADPFIASFLGLLTGVLLGTRRLAASVKQPTPFTRGGHASFPYDVYPPGRLRRR